jgi:hypothetical protein
MASASSRAGLPADSILMRRQQFLRITFEIQRERRAANQFAEKSRILHLENISARRAYSLSSRARQKRMN